MPYIGNTIRAADDYRLIDDISSGFNGSTTSFALQVAGSAPVPFPKSPQQVLISVNGVIQEPDPTGASGFNLVGTNIVFSSAPTNGHAFFGIIYATADYLNAGGNFPSGSLGAPSITFIGDENSGLYRKSGGSVGFVSDATEIANFDSNGITISSGSLIIPDSIIHNGDSNTKIRFSGADTVSVETAGTQRLEVASDGKINFGSVARVEADGVFKAAHGDASTPSYNFLNDNDNGMFRATTNTIGFSTAGTERLRVDSSGRVQIGTAVGWGSNCKLHVSDTSSNCFITISAADDGNSVLAFSDTAASVRGALDYDHDGDFLGIKTAGSERLRIDSSGRLMIGTTTEGHSNADDLTVNNSANCGITIRSGSSSDGNIFFSDDTSGNGETRGVVKYKHADDALVFNSNGSERFRLDSSGRFLLGHNSDIGYGFRSQLVGTDGNTSSQAQIRFTNSASGPTFILAKSRNGTPGSKTIVNANDNLGEIQFRGDDGVDYFGIAASINAEVDGTPGAGDLPGRLVFSTTADGSDSATERMRIDSSGNVGIGTTSPTTLLNVNTPASGTTTAIEISRTTHGTVGKFINSTGALEIQSNKQLILSSDPAQGMTAEGSNIQFLVDGGEKARVDAGGRLLIGHTTSTPMDNDANNPVFAVEGAGNGARIAVRSTDASASNGAFIYLTRTRGTSAGSKTTVQSGDSLGGFIFMGADGTHDTRAAIIQAECDGTPGNDDMPGRLVFMTTPDGGINSSERMRIDSSGAVTIYNKINLGGSGPASRIDPTSAGELYIDADPGSNYGSSTIRFRIDGLEMARIAAGTHKNFLIGRTTTQAQERLSVQNSSNQDVAFLTQSQTAQNTRNVVLLNSYAQTDFANQIVFMDHQGGIRGTIKNNTSSTQYNTSSDYRLKENEVEISDSIERIKKLKPYRFNWKNRPNTTVDGFFAHEVQDIVEDCVSGTKDGVDSNGDPEYQEMDHSKLVPLLTAALKESITKIETLETKVAALEAT